MQFFATYFSKARFLTILLLMVSNLLAMAQTSTREYQLKAAFLFNFTQFVEWPAASFSSAETPWIIGVLGDNPFEGHLDEIVSGEKVNGHPVIVRYYKTAEEIKICHILYINLADPMKRAEAIAGVDNKNILTVSDATNFPQSGGMIRLYTKDNKIRMQVNLEATKTANLVISSKLLKLAEIFTPR